MASGKFYCDVGMKAVLRSIRRVLIKELNSTSNRIEQMSSDLFDETCLRFFSESVRPTENSLYIDEKQVMAIMRLFLDCPSKEPDLAAKITIRVSQKGCKSKRYLKAVDKA